MNDIRVLATFYHNNNIIDDIPSPSINDIIKMLKKYPMPRYEDEEGNPEILSQHTTYLWVAERITVDSPITSTDVCALHYKLYKAVGLKDNGAIRKTSKCVRKYICPPPDQIFSLLKKFDNLLLLLDDMLSHSDDDANAYFFYVHSVFECIQPFAYGNGRVGRFLFNMLRFRKGLPFSEWDVDKEVYYNTIRVHEARFKQKYAIESPTSSEVG